MASHDWFSHYLNGPFSDVMLGRFTTFEVEYAEFIIHSVLLCEGAIAGSEKESIKVKGGKMLFCIVTHFRLMFFR